MDLGLTGRSVLITGASKGIGASAAEVFAEEGCTLHLAARGKEALDGLAERLRTTYGAEVSAHPADLRLPADLARLADALPDLDILINNAGDIPAGSLGRVSQEAWRHGWDLKVYGYIDLTRLVYAKMKERGHGVIINDIGACGERVDAEYIAGTAGNAALMAFTRALGGRSLQDGIRVVGINPGPVATDRITTLTATSERFRDAVAHFPRGRAAEPREIADMMAFLASDRSAYTTGTIITIDGGISSVPCSRAFPSRRPDGDGRDLACVDMTSLTESFHAFRIDIPQGDLDDLHDRLDRTRWPDELPGVGWAYGIPRDYLKELARYWRHEYDWRAAEATLNEWPQFTTTIDGANIHFAHIRSPEPDATPLIMTHGWPGSIVEFAKVAGPLSDPRAHGGDPSDAFHLVLPSIPGFGLSGPTRETGWEYRRVAAAFAELMQRLGYRQYGAQGGDWGAVISRELGRIHTDQILGVHLNLLPGSAATEEPNTDELATLSPAERKRTLASWERNQRWSRDRQGYADIQSTRPQTLAYGLTDSPVGQLAWIAEKFKEWTDSRNRPEDAVDRDQLLTNVMLYWLTGTAGSSARIYYERAHADYWGAPPEPSTAPIALADFPQENFIPLRHIAEQTNNIVQWTEYDRGGHFAAMEQPHLLVADIRMFFRKVSQFAPTG